MSPQPEELRDLLAAYALDAVEPDERREVERALETDPLLRRELSEHLDVLAQLAPEAEASPGLLDRILTALPDHDEPDGHGDTLAASATVVSLDDARRSRAGQLGRAVLAAVAVLALLLIGVGLVRNDKPDDLPGLAEQALADPSADVVELTAIEGGDIVARAAVYPDGDGYLLVDALPALDGDQTYQLWMLPAADAPDAPPISLGLVPADAEAASFRLADGASGVALSQEPTGGSVAPTEVIAVGPFA